MKHQPCRGAQIHVVDRSEVDGLWIGLHLLHALMQHYPSFKWIRYEEKYWIDQLTGSTYLREALNKGMSPENIRNHRDSELFSNGP